MKGKLKKLNKNAPGAKAMELDRKTRSRKQKILDKNKKAKNEAELKKSNERVNKIAHKISKQFTYSKIVSAINGEEGYDVHGYLQINYDDYEELIDNYILDRAAYYSKKDYTPEVINFMYEADLSKMVKTSVKFSREITLDNYPDLPFKEAIFYAKDNLEKSLTWIDETPWELEGYDTNINQGPANVALIGWVLWNKPIILVLHAPGKNEAFFSAKMDAKQISKEKEAIRTKIIHNYRTAEETITEKIDELQRDKKHWQKAYSHFRDKTETERPNNIREEYRQFEIKTIRKSRRIKINSGDIVKILGMATLMIVVIYVLNNLTGWFGGG